MAFSTCYGRCALDCQSNQGIRTTTASTTARGSAVTKEAIKQALEALELMYACYAHPEWISHKQQEEKILAQCAATTMILRQALANHIPDATKMVSGVKDSLTTQQEQDSTCNHTLRAQGKAYPRTCKKCGFGPCINKSKQEQGEPHSWYSAQEDEWMTDKTRKDHERLNSYTHKVGGFDLPLYTTPQQRKPLTDEQIQAIWNLESGALPQWSRHIAFARAIEAAHGIKE